jgi:tetratricopeptide (TPR) repeat protein
MDGGLEPALVLHSDCFSLPVNYHAIGRYFQNKKGSLCLHKKFHDGSFGISFFVTGDGSQSYRATRFAFTEHIEKLGPAEVWAAYTAILENRKNTPLPILLSVIRLCDYDTLAFRMVSDTLLDSINPIGLGLESELLQLLDRTWENFYLMEGSLKDAYSIAQCYYKRHRFTKCLSIYTSILENYGETPIFLCPIAICLYKLGMIHQALPFLKRALEIDNTNSFARDWRSRIEYELKIMGPPTPEISTTDVVPNFPELPVSPLLQCRVRG